MRLFAKRYFLLTAFIAAAVFISDVNAKTQIRHSHGHHEDSVHENHLEHSHHKRSYPSSSGLSGSGKPSSYSKSSKKPSYPSSGGLSGSRNGNHGISNPVHKPVSKPTSSYNKTHGSGNGNRYPSRNSGNSNKPSYPASNGISGSGRKNLTTSQTSPHSAKLTYYPPSNGLSGGSRNNTGSFSSSDKKPGTLYPPSNGLSGGGNRPSGSYKTTPKPVFYPSSKRPPTSSLGNWSNQVVHPKNVSRTNEKPGSLYPPSHGLSGGENRPSGSYNTTPKPVFYPSSKRPPTSSLGNWSNQVVHPKNVSRTNEKPGSLYPPSHDLSGGGNRPSGSYQTTPKPVFYPSSKRPPTSSFGNWSNQVIHPKNVSRTNEKPGSLYPPSQGLSGGGSGSFQTTYKPVFYPPSTKRPPVNNPTVIYQPVVHHIHSYESHSSYMPHHKINTYRPAYMYAPPHEIHYINSNGHVEKYPVYNHHDVPPYINDYRNSENKYGNLLSGLALYNLGMISGSRSKNKFHKQYVQNPNEICTFEAKDKKGNKDEMAIDCIIMTYFIFMDEYKNHILGDSSGISNDSYVMLPNGTLVSDKVAYQLTYKDSKMPLPQVMRPEGTVVYRASEPMFNGKPVDYKLLKHCTIGRSKLYTEFKKEIPCSLLQTYAEKSWRKNSGLVLKSSLPVIFIAICVFFM